MSVKCMGVYAKRRTLKRQMYLRVLFREWVWYLWACRWHWIHQPILLHGTNSRTHTHKRRICPHIQIHIHMYIQSYMYVHIYTLIYIYIESLSYTQAHTPTHTQTDPPTHRIIHLHALFHVAGSRTRDVHELATQTRNAPPKTSVYTQIHIYSCMYIYTYVHIYILMQSCSPTHRLTHQPSSSHTHLSPRREFAHTRAQPWNTPPNTNIYTYVNALILAYTFVS